MMLEMCCDVGIGDNNSIFCLRVMFAHLLGSGAHFYILEGTKDSVVLIYPPVNLRHMRMGNRVLSNQ